MSAWPKCSQENCTDDASARVFWPGREPNYSCAIHALKAQQVGAAIGCYIHAEVLTPDVVRGDTEEPK